MDTLPSLRQGEKKETARAGRGRRGPLAGLNVVDVTHMLAGPYATWVLGALGAEVIKVERPGEGDFTRSIEPRVAGESIYFASVNRNKRSLTLNLKSEGGRDVLRRLVARADVFVENNRPGVMDRLNLGYDALAAINPRLVYASVSGFGQTGPYRDRPAFDMVVQAMAGIMSITGQPDGPPMRVGASIGDIGASLFGVIGILAALQERNRTGRGSHVDVAMFDCQLAIMENAVARWLNAGERPKPLGTRHPMVVPFQVFPARDEPIVVAVDTDEQWRRLCDTIGRRDLRDDARFRTGTARVQNHAALERELVETFRQRDRAEWLSVLEAADIPCGPVNTVDEAIALPQVAARRMIVDLRDRESGQFAAMPIRMRSLDDGEDVRAPRLGEHTAEILGELGLSAEDIERLKASSAI